MAKRTTTNAVEILNRRYGNDPETRHRIDDEHIQARIAQLAYDLRTEANLEQEALAELTGVEASVIAGLEDADYEGNSLLMLERIAEAVGKRISIHVAPAEQSRP